MESVCMPTAYWGRAGDCSMHACSIGVSMSRGHGTRCQTSGEIVGIDEEEGAEAEGRFVRVRTCGGFCRGVFEG